MRDFRLEISGLKKRVDEARAYLNIDQARIRMEINEQELSRPDLWDTPDIAKKISLEYGRDKDDIDNVENLDSKLDDAGALFELGIEEPEDSPELTSLEMELEELLASVSKELDSLELRSLFNSEYDQGDAVCEIHSGAGGTDAQDWAEMMLRMYVRWAERKGFELEIDEVTPGQEAGILSSTFLVKGRFAYGLLSAEKGVHRLVRMSPFDSQHRRQTSFASFDAVPFMEELEDTVEVDDKDLRIDTYRSSGAGGQHVNVTDSAVRITHLPTGIVVSCQNERSQHQNKARAMQILRAKLADLDRRQRQAELEAISGPQSDISWGNQIRSYVMAPFQMVKDLRTQYQTGNVDGVLDGDLDEFMESYLRFKRENEAV